MIVLNYYPNNTVGCSVEMRIPDDDMTPDDVLKHFQRFLHASGYIFDDGKTIQYVQTKKPVFTANSDTLSINTPDQYDFWDDDGFSIAGNPCSNFFYPSQSPDTIVIGSGLRGGMAEDIVTFG